MDAPGWDTIAEDCYMSVRIGEVQKLAKLSASRVYKFGLPAAGQRNYGKVELYRRVGQGIVCIDPALAEGVNEVHVAQGDDTLLSVNVDVKWPSSAGAAAPGSDILNEDEDAERGKTRRKAKDYLQQHHLEARLAEAMRMVLHEKPDDPVAAMADKLMGNSRVAPRLPSPAPPPPPPAAPGAASPQEEEGAAKCTLRLAAQASGEASPQTELCANKSETQTEIARLLAENDRLRRALGEDWQSAEARERRFVDATAAAAAAVAVEGPAPDSWLSDALARAIAKTSDDTQQANVPLGRVASEALAVVSSELKIDSSYPLPKPVGVQPNSMAQWGPNFWSTGLRPTC